MSTAVITDTLDNNHIYYKRKMENQQRFNFELRITLEYSFVYKLNPN